MLVKFPCSLVLAAVLTAVIAASCAAPRGRSAAESPSDPSRGEVTLPCADGWNASLLYESDVGVWTVRSFQVLPRYGCPEVLGLDDRGRCTVLISYSGKWTPVQTVFDGQWLAPVTHADVDPRRDGHELYAGGKRGNLYQIHPRPAGGFDTNIIATYPGEEIHTLVSGDLAPHRPGNELLAFTKSGEVYDLRPDGEPFTSTRLASLPGRVRDARLLPAAAGQAPWIATASRAGEVALLRLTETGLERRVILQEPIGFGRITGRADDPGVLYVTRDDGLILRLSGDPGGPTNAPWAREVVYAGPQGPRGLVAGRFDEDPDVETLAVFGYSKKVQILAREPGGPWTVRTVFTDLDRGHWLEVAELDGRNGTDEIVGSGYSGRIFLLSRPPGYGLGSVATDPTGAVQDPSERPVRTTTTDGRGGAERPLRVAVRALPEPSGHLTPLSYRGGFETKTLIYETLVKRDAQGRIAPGLASSWRLSDDGLSVVFTLRDGAVFHDGTPVDARAVRIHFLRWVGLPEHAWLRASDRITDVVAESRNQLRITTDRPCALLPDLCAINPCSITGPGSLDHEGRFVRPVGSGPFRFERVLQDSATVRYSRFGQEAGEVDLVRFEAGAKPDPLEALRRDLVDVVLDGWFGTYPRERIARFAADPGYRIREGPGSSVVYLSFRLTDGASARAGVRRAIAAAIDRDELVRLAEQGWADPCTAWAAPSVRVWPAGQPSAPGAPPVETPAGTLRLLVRASSARQVRLGRLLVMQLGRAGLAARSVKQGSEAYEAALEEGRFDLRLEQTWGVPYDPYLSLVARFGRPPATPSGASSRPTGVDSRLAELVEQATAEPGASGREAVYRQIQALMDREALIVPLYVPRRLAVSRAGTPDVAMDHDLYRLNLSAPISMNGDV